jgi:hypothetical protein
LTEPCDWLPKNISVDLRVAVYNQRASPQASPSDVVLLTPASTFRVIHESEGMIQPKPVFPDLLFFLNQSVNQLASPVMADQVVYGWKFEAD